MGRRKSLCIFRTNYETEEISRIYDERSETTTVLRLATCTSSSNSFCFYGLFKLLLASRQLVQVAQVSQVSAFLESINSWSCSMDSPSTFSKLQVCQDRKKLSRSFCQKEFCGTNMPAKPEGVSFACASVCSCRGKRVKRMESDWLFVSLQSHWILFSQFFLFGGGTNVSTCLSDIFSYFFY